MLKGPRTIRADWTASEKSLREALFPGRNDAPDKMTTAEAARYLRKSESWLLRQHDIEYVRGIPNTYERVALDDWFERHKYVPEVA